MSDEMESRALVPAESVHDEGEDTVDAEFDEVAVTGKLEPNKDLYEKGLERLWRMIAGDLMETLDVASELNLGEGEVGDVLPAVFTFHHRNNSGIHLKPGQWGQKRWALAEVGVNARCLHEWPLEELVKGLVIKQAVVLQRRYGSVSRKTRASYMNKQLVAMVKAAGLVPVSPDGKRETGDKLAWEVKPGGAFEKVMRKLEKKNFRFAWRALPQIPDGAVRDSEAIEEPPQTKSGKKVKYVCPVDPGRDHIAVWGKERQEADIKCVPHDVNLVRADELEKENGEHGKE